MVSFETEVYHKQEEDVIGVKVIVIADNGQTIDTIHVVNETDFNELKAKLDVLNEGYVQFADESSLAGKTIEQILANAQEIATINATNLNGYQSDAFAKASHTHSKSEITNLYSYDLTLSAYNALLGNQITVTVTVLDSSNSPVNKHEVIIYKNGSLWKTGKTNAQGVFTTKYTCEAGGLITFQVNNQKAQCLVNGWEEITISPGQMSFYVNKSSRLAELQVKNTNANIGAAFETRYLNAIPEAYRPFNQVLSPCVSRLAMIEITSDGSIYFRSTDGNAHKVSNNNGQNASCTLQWRY